MGDPFDVVDKFEQELCEYTGAPFAVAVASCTDALGICLELLNQASLIQYWMSEKKIILPKYTYKGVATQIKRAGWNIEFKDIDWKGTYRLFPTPIWDSARRFTSGMFKEECLEDGIPIVQYICVSFHASKILGYSHGGAILHNDKEFSEISNEMRFDSRTNTDREATILGRHANMTPDIAAALRYKLYHLPANNPDLPNSDYPDLSKMEIFK